MFKSVGNTVLALAKRLHESTRAHVGNFIEWEDLDRTFAGQKVFIAQAQMLIDTYAMLPLDDTRACSGCRTLTDALNDMDESRRQLIAGRDAVVKFLESATEQSLADRGMVEKVRDQLKEEAGEEDPEDVAIGLNLIQFVLDSESLMRHTPAVTSEQEVSLDTP